MVTIFIYRKGSAFLVKHRGEDTFYVAKKMMLEGMAEREKTLAWGEVKISSTFLDLNIEEVQRNENPIYCRV